MGAFDDLPMEVPPARGGTFDDLPGETQMGGFWRTPALAGSYLAKGALASTGALGDLENFLHRQFTSGIYDPLHRLATGQPAERALTAANNPTFDPLTGQPATDALGRLAGGGLNSTNLLAGGKALGAVDRPDLQPQTTGEKFLASTAEGVGGVLPFLPLGGTNPASLWRGVAQGAGAGAAGEAGAQLVPSYADAARAVAGLGGMALGGRAFDLGNRAVSATRGATTPLQDAYRTLGIEQNLVGDVAQSPFAQMLQGYGARSPGGTGRVTAARERAVGQWGQALDDTAAGYGTATNLQEAGATLQAESQAWMGRFRQAQTAAEQEVAARVPVTAPVDLAPVNRVLNAATRRMPGLPTVAGIHDNPTFQNLRTALATDAPTGTARWEDIRQWRTAIGEELERSLVSRDGNQAAWRQLYGALSRSLGNTATAHNAQTEWQAANQISSQGHQFIEGTLNKIINNVNPAQNTIRAEDAAKAAFQGSNAGGTTLQGIRQEMPAAADDLAAARLRSAGLARVQNAAGTEVSPRKLVTELSPNKLAPQARDALFGSDPDLARRVDDLARVGEAMRRSEGFFNWSGTGGHIATGQMLTGVLGGLYGGYQGFREGGVPGAISGAAGPLAAGLLPGFLASRAITSPRMAGFLAAPVAGGVPSNLPLTVGMAYPELRGLLNP